MLTEAGDTFHQKDDEIESLKKVINEYEDRVKQQVIKKFMHETEQCFYAVYSAVNPINLQAKF